MKILQIGNFGIKRNLSQFYNVDYKLYFGLIRNGHSVFQFSNRDIARQVGIIKSRLGSAKRVNKKLLQVCSQLKPEMILIGHAEQITNQTLEQIKSDNPNIKIAYFNVDALWVKHNKNLIRERLKCKSLDSFFITTAGESILEFKREGLQISFMPNPSDKAIDRYKCFENAAPKFDCFFAGSGEMRINFVNELESNLPNIKFNNLTKKGLVYGQQYFDELTQCRMGLNIPQFEEDEYQPYLYSSDRIAQYFGNGLLTFLHEKTGYKSFLKPNEDAIYYSSKSDLAEKIHEYKLNDNLAKKIAESGWKKYHMLYASENISQYVVASITLGHMKLG